ncbi:MAG: outer membrane beta-barrel protein [Bdellovibrionota bacterium]
MTQLIKKINHKLLILTLASAASSANAFDLGGMKLGVGPKLSLNANKASIGSAGSSSFGFGYGVGAYSVLDLDFVALELGLQYSERRFEFSNLLGFGGDYAATLKQIEIPFLAYYKHSLGETLALRAGAGAQLEFGVGDVKGDSGSVSYSQAGVSKSSSSLLFDIGGDYVVSELGTITFDLRYALGLKDRAESSGLLFNDKFKTQYIELAAGFLF